MLPSQPPELEQTVPGANDLLFTSKCPGGPSPCPNSHCCPQPRLQHTLPSWCYSDRGGHIRSRGARSCGQAGHNPDPKSTDLA